ncbi:hypothetical protein G6F42_025305 [Rhizopus arrhizus]|nr:hypothetical protein G6F42_025305 [Rhizopus arrhizus]
MDDIKQLLDRTGLLSLKDAGLTIISLYGVSEAKQSSTIVNLANTIVGANVFAARHKSVEKPAVEKLENDISVYRCQYQHYKPLDREIGFSQYDEPSISNNQSIALHADIVSSGDRKHLHVTKTQMTSNDINATCILAHPATVILTCRFFVNIGGTRSDKIQHAHPFSSISIILLEALGYRSA